MAALGSWELADELLRALRSGTASGTLLATVTRVDEGGTTWVRLPGSASETPVNGIMLSDARTGDQVSATLFGGRLSVVGNATNPSVGQPAVDEAVAPAVRDATSALVEARRARVAALSAEQDAARAAGAADAASEMAESASESAASASESAGVAQSKATAATYSLSEVEKVVGTLNWIAEHGSYEAATETSPVADRIYYERSGTGPDYTYTVVESVPYSYALTSDSSVDPGKTYYERSGSGTSESPYVYVEVSEPTAEGLPTYYERSEGNPSTLGYYYLIIDESVQNYIASHIWMDDYGLNVSVDSASGYKIHQGTVDGTHPAGMYIIDGSGNVVQQMNVNGQVIGKIGESHVEVDYHSLRLIDKEGYTYFYLSDLRGSDGYATVTETIVPDGAWTDISTNFRPRSVETTTATVDGVEVTVSYVGTGGVRLSSVAPAGSTVVVTYQTDSRFVKAYTVGVRFPDSEMGSFSLAEGYYNKASGAYSHAEGSYTNAVGYSSHAEGSGNTSAIGGSSHAEGWLSVAKGSTSHAQNRGTIASKMGQTAIGSFNVEDSSPTTTHPSGTAQYGTYAAIIGNGTADNARSNALAVRWNGLSDVAGRTCYPTFVYPAFPTTNNVKDESQLPVTPCFVLDASDGAFYFCDGA